MSSSESNARLAVVDYVVLAVVLCISMSIGLYHAFCGGKQRTTNEYLMANRKLKVLNFILSILTLITQIKVEKSCYLTLSGGIENSILLIVMVVCYLPYLYGFVYMDLYGFSFNCCITFSYIFFTCRYYLWLFHCLCQMCQQFSSWDNQQRSIDMGFR